MPQEFLKKKQREGSLIRSNQRDFRRNILRNAWKILVQISVGVFLKEFLGELVKVFLGESLK